jgi:hypothetical protein
VFGAWLLQAGVSSKWVPGGEGLADGRDTDAGQGTTILDCGGSRRFTADFNLLSSAGRSANGDAHTVACLGLRGVAEGNRNSPPETRRRVPDGPQNRIFPDETLVRSLLAWSPGERATWE